MLSVATAEHPDIKFFHADMSDLSFINNKYDVVFSSLALHYIENFNMLARQISDILNPGGYFVFSQEHPLTTAPVSGSKWTKDADGNVLHYNLSDYTKSGKRNTNWIVDGVVKYHRTFSEIINSLSDAGFFVEKVLEPVPSEETIKRDKSREKNLHKPIFLLIKARKI